MHHEGTLPGEKQSLETFWPGNGGFIYHPSSSSSLHARIKAFQQRRVVFHAAYRCSCWNGLTLLQRNAMMDGSGPVRDALLIYRLFFSTPCEWMCCAACEIILRGMKFAHSEPIAFDWRASGRHNAVCRLFGIYSPANAILVSVVVDVSPYPCPWQPAASHSNDASHQHNNLIRLALWGSFLFSIFSRQLPSRD